ncbi:unnamed protein product [Discula destructiva]
MLDTGNIVRLHRLFSTRAGFGGYRPLGHNMEKALLYLYCEKAPQKQCQCSSSAPVPRPQSSQSQSQTTGPAHSLRQPHNAPEDEAAPTWQKARVKFSTSSALRRSFSSSYSHL